MRFLSWHKSILMLVTSFLILQVYVILVTTSSLDVQSSALNLSKNVEYLRGEDDRLVRYNVPDKESQSRQKEICTTHYLDAVMHRLSNLASSIDSVSSSIDSYRIMGLCLQLLTLCATNNHGKRNYIGQYKEGETLVNIVTLIQHPFSHSLLQVVDKTLLDTAIRTSAYASESMWILSFNSPNHDVFVDADGVKALRTVIVSSHMSSSINVGKMWALAALQNLAASYCESPTGHCRWYYDKATGNVTLHPKTPLIIDGLKARSQMVHDTKLIHSITNLTCHPPSSSSGQHSEDNPWPTLATVRNGLDELHVRPTWAAAGAVKNIILSQDAWADIVPRKDCLCDLKYSADWLEAEKAQDALARLGLSQTCTAPWYKHCRDATVSDNEGKTIEWMNGFKETCIMYGENKWCMEHGQLQNDEGISANDACCACGGGIQISLNSDEL